MSHTRAITCQYVCRVWVFSPFRRSFGSLVSLRVPYCTVVLYYVYVFSLHSNVVSAHLPLFRTVPHGLHGRAWGRARPGAGTRESERDSCCMELMCGMWNRDRIRDTAHTSRTHTRHRHTSSLRGSGDLVERMVPPVKGNQKDVQLSRNETPLSSSTASRRDSMSCAMRSDLQYSTWQTRR